ncbi:hypothetical protein Tco_0515753, partial [Tanacetum coccineum]
GLVQQETHVIFQSLIQSGLCSWAQGLVQPEPHVLSQGLGTDTGMLTPDVTIDVSMSS